MHRLSNGNPPPRQRPHYGAQSSRPIIGHRLSDGNPPPNRRRPATVHAPSHCVRPGRGGYGPDGLPAFSAEITDTTGPMALARTGPRAEWVGLRQESARDDIQKELMMPIKTNCWKKTKTRPISKRPIRHRTQKNMSMCLCERSQEKQDCRAS